MVLGTDTQVFLCAAQYCGAVHSQLSSTYLQSSIVPPGDQVPSGHRRQMPVPVEEPYPLLHLSGGSTTSVGTW